MVLWGGSHRNRTVSIMLRIGRNTLTGSVRSEISCVLSVAAKMRRSFCAFLLSHPARGAWIEIWRPRPATRSRSMSHPARGAWIEMLYCPSSRPHSRLSHPARGAWIEMAWTPPTPLPSECRTPQGVRGLKIEIGAEIPGIYVVAPRKGRVD